MKAQADAVAAIEAELQEERAYALGLAGKKVEAALDALTTDPRDMEQLLDEAGTAVWHYYIMREALGMFDHEAVVTAYRIPGRVLARVGVVRRT